MITCAACGIAIVKAPIDFEPYCHACVRAILVKHAPRRAQPLYEYKLLSTLPFAGTLALEAELNRLAGEAWELMAFQNAVYEQYTPPPLAAGMVRATHTCFDPIFVLRRRLSA